MAEMLNNIRAESYLLKDDGRFPNNGRLPVLLYRNALQLPFFSAAAFIEDLFQRNNWGNSWRNGIFTYHHYHSITHEVLGFYKGGTQVQLGGEHGIKLTVKKGDVLIIPAGVAHKNLGRQNSVSCMGAYPDGLNYDMNYGQPGERPATDERIKKVPLPSKDPVGGAQGELLKAWKK